MALGRSNFEFGHFFYPNPVVGLQPLNVLTEFSITRLLERRPRLRPVAARMVLAVANASRMMMDAELLLTLASAIDPTAVLQKRLPTLVPVGEDGDAAVARARSDGDAIRRLTDCALLRC